MDRNYPKLTIEEFGKVLLESGDLDPVYIALHRMRENNEWEEGQLYRWLLAYILCYHVGAACWLSEKTGVEFFAALHEAAENKMEAPTGGRWPRSSERRHWRGEFAIEVVRRLYATYAPVPELFIKNIAHTELESGARPAAIPFSVLSGRVRNHHGFGSWGAFKLADLIDRIGIAPVDFSYDDVVIYKDPVLAAEMVYRQKHGLTDNVKVKPEGVRAVFNYLIEHFSDYAAPPLYDRPVGVQEVESQLCKYKSFLNGHYPLYNDIREIHNGLKDWSLVSPTALAFRTRMPVVPVG